MNDYGPQHEHVAALIERVLALTPQERRVLQTWKGAVCDYNSDARYKASQACTLTKPRVSWNQAWCAVTGAAWGPAWDALAGLMARPRIGKHPFTQADYDALTMPWRVSIGRIHPDDEEVPSNV